MNQEAKDEKWGGKLTARPTQTTSAGPTSASAIRIRENQRRSRARRKEYVETMERKVQEYERRGIDATLEMQQAARTVAVENARLRMMLAQMGAGSADVDAFLQTFQDRDAAHTLSSVRFLQGQPPSSSSSSSTTTASSSAAAQAQGCCDEFARHDGGGGSYGRGLGTGLAVVEMPRLNRACPPLDVLASASVQQGCCDDGDGRFAQVPALSSTRAESPSTVEPSPGAATPSSQGAGLLGSPLSMSCDAAAQIIADMQGCAVGRGLVKEEPGYGGQDKCLASNDSNHPVLFQVLESHSQFR
ncbi:hypothetical protein HRG_000622 [Hirsutella rhossiliensis]|uniref:BZIP domain-containing protein n=1 Tax=Hirsutella rhossiliensis TaxID=111463 RepID=A0A9P8N6R9_9HYPO|nr:uncharacterized protein HRG_00622 [Hirsutella rhossiliensis]KAH0967980.1 hypothetical protein HRG_00622 [Hirsutella rhossiliensis]